MAELESHLPEAGTGGFVHDGNNRPGWVDAIRDAADDPNWPPLPTMASEGGLPAAGGVGAVSGRPLRIRPRGVRAGGLADLTGGKQPITGALQTPVLVHFHCPSCLSEMQVLRAELELDFSCPSCLAVVAPPRVVRR